MISETDFAATIHRNSVIMTKYLGPTNTRGSRVKATSGSGKSITVAWDHEADADMNHARAAIHLASTLWNVAADTLTLRGGCHDGCDGFAWTVSIDGRFA